MAPADVYMAAYCYPAGRIAINRGDFNKLEVSMFAMQTRFSGTLADRISVRHKLLLIEHRA